MRKFEGITVVESSVFKPSHSNSPNKISSDTVITSEGNLSKLQSQPIPRLSASINIPASHPEQNPTGFEINKFKIQVSIQDQHLLIEAHDIELLKFYKIKVDNKIIGDSTGGFFKTVEEMYEVLVDAMTGIFPDLSVSLSEEAEIKLWHGSVYNNKRKTVPVIGFQLEEEVLSPIEAGERILKDLTKTKLELLSKFDLQLMKVLEKLVEQGKAAEARAKAIEEKIRKIEERGLNKV